jgi:hypothetical protein
MADRSSPQFGAGDLRQLADMGFEPAAAAGALGRAGAGGLEAALALLLAEQQVRFTGSTQNLHLLTQQFVD